MSDSSASVEELSWFEKVLPPLQRPPEVVADTARSHVLRLWTSEGVAYFKTDRILPPPEASILVRLTKSWPSALPPLLAVDEERGWTITKDVGSTKLDKSDTETWCRTVRRFAAIQLDPGVPEGDWLDLGTRDLRGPNLLPALEEMLQAAKCFLDPVTIKNLDALRPRIAQDCHTLATDGVPTTLVHQDLVPVNIAIRNGEPVFLDWSDTVVGHPFFGFDRLLDACWTQPERKAAVIDAYLSSFESISPSTLRASFACVSRLRVFYEDLRWHHEIQAAGPHTEHAAHLRKDQLQGLTIAAKPR